MQCPNCATVNPPGSRFCGGCGFGLAGAAPPPKPPPPPAYGYPPPPQPYFAPPPMPMGPLPSYNWVLGILATLFCCQLGGIISIVYGAQVSSKAAAGDYGGAQSSLSAANGWMLASFIIGFLAWGAFCGLQVLGAVAEGSMGSY